MSGSASYESGIRPSRTEYHRENTTGTPNTNPAWELFSDNVRTFDPDPGADISQQRGRGSADSQGAYAGTETPSVTVVYDLQQKTASGNTFLDGSGNPNDAVTDGLLRDADNRINDTHSIVDRIEQSDVSAANTWSGSTSRDTRQYWVVKGAYPDEAMVTGDPEDGQPNAVEIAYEAERIRHYQVDQPTSSEGDIEIWANSTAAADTAVQLTVEDEGAATTESITLNGTTVEGPTTATFGDVDALELNTTATGDVWVFVDDGTGTAEGDKIAEIPGDDAFDHGDGALGIPALGSGSHASAIGQAYEVYHDDSVEQPSGTTVGENFEGTEFAVSNNVEGDGKGGSSKRGLSAGDREVTVDVVVYGETETQERVADMLQTNTDHVRWTMDGGYIQANTSSVDADPDALEASQSKSTTSLSFTGQGVAVGN